MRHVIVFCYIFTILIGVSALTIQWLAGKGDKEKTFTVMKPFVGLLLFMNVYDFAIYYFDNIRHKGVSNLMLSIGDAIIAILVLLWLKVENSVYSDEEPDFFVKITERYVAVYMAVWLVSVVLFRDEFWIRLVIDVPLIVLLVLGSLSCISRSMKKKEPVKLVGYKVVISVFMTMNYASFFFSESGLLHTDNRNILDMTIFFWLVINAANLVLLYKRDFYNSYMTEPAVQPQPQTMSLETALENVRASYELTKREVEILSEIYAGKTNTQIAGELFISESTVKAHVYNLFRKLDVKSRVEAVCIVREEKEGKQESR